MKHFIILLLVFSTIVARAHNPTKSVLFLNKNQPVVLAINKNMFLTSTKTEPSKLTTAGKNLTIIGATSLGVGGILMGIGYGTMTNTFATDSAKFGSLASFFGGAGLGVLGTGLLLSGGPMWAIGSIKDKAKSKGQKRVYIGLQSSSALAFKVEF